MLTLRAEDDPPGNSCVSASINKAPRIAGKKTKLSAEDAEKVDPLLLLPETLEDGHRPYMHYSGSLTTPPCSEEVNWFVMVEPMQVGAEQVLQFMRYAGGSATYSQNSRPLQPLLGRSIDYYEM